MIPIYASRLYHVLPTSTYRGTLSTSHTICTILFPFHITLQIITHLNSTTKSFSVERSFQTTQIKFHSIHLNNYSSNRIHEIRCLSWKCQYFHTQNGYPLWTSTWFSIKFHIILSGNSCANCLTSFEFNYTNSFNCVRVYSESIRPMNIIQSHDISLCREECHNSVEIFMTEAFAVWNAKIPSKFTASLRPWLQRNFRY